MLGIFESQKESGEIGKNLSDYLVAGWNPGPTGESAMSPWSKRDEHGRDHNGQGPEVCWDSNGSVLPLATLEMTPEEREVCLILVSLD
jgi:PERQ amino acid-rich with GYF domain-containing protein